MFITLSKSGRKNFFICQKLFIIYLILLLHLVNTLLDERELLQEKGDYAFKILNYSSCFFLAIPNYYEYFISNTI